MEGFIFPVFWAGFILIMLLVTFINRQQGEARKKPWEKLAAAHNLEFVSGDLFSGSYVWGRYRGHNLRLETVRKKDGNGNQTHTRIVLDLNQSQNFELGRDKGDINAITVERVVELLKPQHMLRGDLTIIAGGRQLCYDQCKVETDIQYLNKLFDRLAELAEVQHAVTLGGELVSSLAPIAADKNNDMYPIAVHLLQSIGIETRRQLQRNASQLVCPYCMARCGAHKVRLSWFNSITYYGCRVCDQSRMFLNVDGPVVATLDDRMETDHIHQNGGLRVNWLVRRTLFDFDTVEIMQASDEDVERFAVQVGNDTDPVRQSRYRQMRSVIAMRCGISENSRRVLQQIFGQVEIKQFVA